MLQNLMDTGEKNSEMEDYKFGLKPRICLRINAGVFIFRKIKKNLYNKNIQLILPQI